MGDRVGREVIEGATAPSGTPVFEDLTRALIAWAALRSSDRDDVLAYYLRDIIDDHRRRGVPCEALRAALRVLESAGQLHGISIQAATTTEAP